MKHDLIIVGGGIAGSAAALRAVQYNLRIAWFRGDNKTAKRSRAQWVANIDNMIGIHDGVLKSKLRKKLKGEAHAEALGIIDGHHDHISARDLLDNTLARIEDSYAEQVDRIDEPADEASAASQGAGFTVKSASRTVTAPFMVLATGVMDRQPSIKRQKGEAVIDEPKWIFPFANRETVLYCIRCEGHLTKDRPTAVIGSGEAAAQLAMMLYERYGSGCAVLTNGESPSWSADASAGLSAYGIGVRTERLTNIEGRKGQLNSIELEGGEVIEVKYALVSMGLYQVYNQLAVQLGAQLTDEGQPQDQRHVLIDRQGATSLPGLYAIGDMTRRADEGVMKQVYTSQEYAVRAVDAIDRQVRQAKRSAAIEAARSSAD